MNMRIKLFDAAREFVGEFEIDPAPQTPPQVVLWGDRIFLHGPTAEPAAYYEDPAAVYRIPGPPPSVLRLGW
jgi:hypothetical protein